MDDIVIQDQYATKNIVDFAPVIEEAEPPTAEMDYRKQVFTLRNMVRGTNKMEIIKYCITEIKKKVTEKGINNNNFDIFLMYLPDNQIEPKMEVQEYINTANSVKTEIDALSAQNKDNKQNPVMMETFMKYFTKYTHDKIWIDIYYGIFKENQAQIEKDKSNIKTILHEASDLNYCNQQNAEEVFNQGGAMPNLTPGNSPPFSINTRDDYVKLLAKIKASAVQIKQGHKINMLTMEEASNLLQFEKEVDDTVRSYEYTTGNLIGTSGSKQMSMDSFAFQFQDGNMAKVRSFNKSLAKDGKTALTFEFTEANGNAENNIYLYSVHGWDPSGNKIKMINENAQIKVKDGAKEATGDIFTNFDDIMQMSEVQTFYVKKINNQFLLTLQEKMLVNKPAV